MSAKCCSKPNVTTYSDGSGICQSCRTTFEAGEMIEKTGIGEDRAAELEQKVEALQGDLSSVVADLAAAQGELESLANRVLTLEGNAVTPS